MLQNAQVFPMQKNFSSKLIQLQVISIHLPPVDQITEIAFNEQVQSRLRGCVAGPGHTTDA